MLIDDLLARCTFDLSVGELNNGTGESGSDTIQCAVSGGADSLALLALACRYGRRRELGVVAHHVDHQIQNGSHPRRLVEDACRALGTEFEFHLADVESGSNMEQRARDARYALLPPNALTGHTQDDQAETVLLQLMRGAGPQGLAAMSPLRRPILALRRTETEAVCTELGLEFVIDPMNADSRFLRNRVRHEVLPLLADVAQRDVVPVLARAATHQASVVSLLDGLGRDIDPTDAASLRKLHPTMVTTVLRRWWFESTLHAYSPDAAAMARMDDVINLRATATDIVDGWRLERTGGTLRLVPPIV